MLRDLARHRPPNVDIVLVTPSTQLRYSGMLPGWIAGNYTAEALTIELAPLAQAAGATRISARVEKLDLANRIAFTDGGEASTSSVVDPPGPWSTPINQRFARHALPCVLRVIHAGWEPISQRGDRAKPFP